RRDMVCVSAHASPYDFSIDFGAACFGVLQAFEDDRASTLARHEAVPIFVERARRGLWIVVAGRQCVHGVETADTRFVYNRFRAAGDDDVGISGTDVVKRVN